MLNRTMQLVGLLGRQEGWRQPALPRTGKGTAFQWVQGNVPSYFSMPLMQTACSKQPSCHWQASCAFAFGVVGLTSWLETRA